MGEVCSLTHSHSLIAWLAASDSTWDLGQTRGKEHAARSSWLSQVSFLSRPSAQLSPAGASALLVSCRVISSSIHAYHYTHTAKNVFCREVTIILETASSVRPGMWYCELNHSLPGWQPHVGILKVPAGPLCSNSLLMHLEGS